MSEHQQATTQVDGQKGSVILDGTTNTSWTSASGTWVMALIPMSDTAVLLDTATGNATNLASKSFTKPILGRWSAITLNSASGDCQLVYG
jgi:hypothetical protein